MMTARLRHHHIHSFSHEYQLFVARDVTKSTARYAKISTIVVIHTIELHVLQTIVYISLAFDQNLRADFENYIYIYI